MDILKLAKTNEDYTINVRRSLHKIPELELYLPKTTAFICSELDKMNIEYKKLINGNGIVATLYGTGEGANLTLGIRADMDALPIEEETGCDFASEHSGCMHACGHDAHCAIALTTLKILNENRNAFSGAVKFIFQPGEEYPGGAEPMIAEGALENPHVDYIIGMHTGGLFTELKNGQVGFRSGALFSAVDVFNITINGKGGHGAAPHTTIDPIVITAEIVLALQKIVSREIAPLSSAVVTIGKIHSGVVQNIIPDKAEIVGTTRTLSPADRQFIKKRITEIATGISAAYGASAEVQYDHKYPVLINDEIFTERVKNASAKLLGDDVVEIKEPTMGSEDMAYFLEKAPGTFFILSNLKPHSDGICYPHHNSKFNIDETVLYKAVTVMLSAVREYLG